MRGSIDFMLSNASGNVMEPKVPALLDLDKPNYFKSVKKYTNRLSSSAIFQPSSFGVLKKARAGKYEFGFIHI